MGGEEKGGKMCLISTSFIPTGQNILFKADKPINRDASKYKCV